MPSPSCRALPLLALLAASLAAQAQESATTAGGDKGAPAAEGAKPADAARPAASRRIEFVHMGGNDCPPCVLWRAIELPKLQALPEYKLITFHYVTKTIKSPVPPAFFFPSDAKHLQAELMRASSGFNGAPHQAILVDGKVVDYWFGTGGGKGDATALAAMFRAIHEGKPLPRPTCTQLASLSSCKQGPAAAKPAT